MGILNTAKTIVTNAPKSVLSIFKKKTTTSSTIDPDKKSVVVTDFSDGSSIKTETSTSGTTGTTTKNTTHRGVGGSSVSPEQANQMDIAKANLDIQKAEQERNLQPYRVTNPTTERGERLSAELNNQTNVNAENVYQVNKKSQDYYQQRFDYYQNLLNKKKVTIEYANIHLKEDIEIYQAKLIDAENKRRPEAFQQAIDKYATEEIGEFKGIDDNITTWQKVKTFAKAVTYDRSQLLPKETIVNLQQARQDNLLRSLIYGVPASIPFKSKLNAFNEQTNLNQKNKALEELGKIVDNSPEQTKYDVQQKGLDLLYSQGARFDYGNPYSLDEKGNIIANTETSIKLYGSDLSSENILNQEDAVKSKTKFDDILVGTNIVSTKALESYGFVKGIGFVGNSIGGLFKGKALVNFGDPAIKKIASGTLKFSAGTTLGGIYVLGLNQKKAEYQSLSPEGKKVFWLETAGELGGFGLTIGENAVAKYQITKLNKRVEIENYLLNIEREGLLNIKQIQSTGKGLINYDQAGYGISLGSIQEKQLIREVSRIAGVDSNEALNLIKEGSFAKTTTSIKSIVPSTKRALNELRTGKLSVGDDIYRIDKYTGVISLKSSSGLTQSIGIDFTASGNSISNVRLKTLIGNGNVAYQNVFEKVRRSTRNVKAGGNNFIIDDASNRWVLRESILTKATKGGTTDLTLIENRLIENGFYPKKRIKFSSDEVLMLGNDKNILENSNFDNLWERSGSAGRTSIFVGKRNEGKLFIDTNIGRIISEDITAFKQKGLGNKFVSLKNVLKNMVFSGQEGAKKLINKTPLSKTFGEDIAIGGGEQKTIQNEVLKDEILTKQIQNQLLQTPSASGFKVNTNVRFKEMNEVKNILKGEQFVGFVFKGNQRTGMKERNVQKEDFLQKDANAEKQLQNLLQNLNQNQNQRLKSQQRSQQISNSINAIAMEKSLFNMNIFSPSLQTPKTPKVYAKPFDFESKKRNAQLKKKMKKKGLLTFGLLPDFTARSVGLASPEFSVKDIEKQLMKIKTGGEIRTGALIKWQ